MISPTSFLLLVALIVGVRPAEAAPLTYTMTLTPDSVTCLGVPCPPGTTVEGNHPPPTVGQPYLGSFTLQDDSVLATDGINLPATLTAFHLTLGDQFWDAFQPKAFPGVPGNNNLFQGFRGPRPGDPDCPGGTPRVCLGAESPGFDVAGGQLVGLFGDVFGQSDVPFVDFEFFTGATDRFQSNPGGSVFVKGTILLAQVSAPPALLLLSAGLGLTGLISEMLRQREGHR